jgi:hypothetical protein
MPDKGTAVTSPYTRPAFARPASRSSKKSRGSRPQVKCSPVEKTARKLYAFAKAGTPGAVACNSRAFDSWARFSGQSVSSKDLRKFYAAKSILTGPRIHLPTPRRRSVFLRFHAFVEVRIFINRTTKTQKRSESMCAGRKSGEDRSQPSCALGAVSGCLRAVPWTHAGGASEVSGSSPDSRSLRACDGCRSCACRT